MIIYYTGEIENERAENVTLWVTGEVHAEFWLGDLRERDHLEDIDVDVSVVIEWIFRNWDGEAWTGSMWPRDRC
jgi:hypothetical protein